MEGIMHIGERIRRQRDKLGISQRELARRMGIPQPVISDFERGVRDEMTTALLKNFAQHLGCTTDYLVGMYEDEESELWAAMVG
jgi:transcriptional regulator with XRE-family HTH domain